MKRSSIRKYLKEGYTKKILLFISFVFMSITSQALAVNYHTDVLEPGNPGGWTASLKTFDDELRIVPGQQFSFDIWIKDAPATAYSGGFWMDFTSSTDKVAYLSCGRAFTNGSEGVVGPWTPGAGTLVNEPAGPGTLLVQVINLGGAGPDRHGDIIIARVTFQCIEEGDVELTVGVHPSVQFWALSPPWDDNLIEPHILTIHQECECHTDADCKDRLWCTGAETCNPNCMCLPGIPPCDDGNVCSYDTCREADPHCGSDLNCEAIEGVCKHYCDVFYPGCMNDPICYSFFCDFGYIDYDCDYIGDDGDGDGILQDHPCTSGQTENCDDNCFRDKNSDQADEGDGDGVGDACDNCSDTPNGPYGGTCTKGSVGSFCMNNNECGPRGLCSMNQEDNDKDGWGDVCDPDDDNDGTPDSEDNCPFIANPNQNDSDSDGAGDLCDHCPNLYNPNQEDTFPPQGNGIGDACDCEGNFDCDQDVDAADVAAFLQHFGRSQYNRPCTNVDPCKGDFSCDGDVDAMDVAKFREDFGRNQYNNLCPLCEAGIPWCNY